MCKLVPDFHCHLYARVCVVHTLHLACTAVVVEEMKKRSGKANFREFLSLPLPLLGISIHLGSFLSPFVFYSVLITFCAPSWPACVCVVCFANEGGSGRQRKP